MRFTLQPSGSSSSSRRGMRYREEASRAARQPSKGLLRMKDREARLPPGTTSRLERAYRAPPPTDEGLRKGWKNSIVSLPTAAAATAEDTATAAEAAPEVQAGRGLGWPGAPIALASRLLASASLRTFSCALLAVRLRTRPPRKTSQRRRARSRDSNCYFKYISGHPIHLNLHSPKSRLL